MDCLTHLQISKSIDDYIEDLNIMATGVAKRADKKLGDLGFIVNRKVKNGHFMSSLLGLALINIDAKEQKQYYQKKGLLNL